MQPIVSSGEMKSLDLLVAKRYSLPLLLLMENAGREIAKSVVSYIANKQIKKPKILIVAGPGNNGGDGFVCARHLLAKIDDIAILLIALFDKQYQGDAKVNYDAITKMAQVDQRIKVVENSLSKLGQFQADIIIDAIFGTGFKGSPSGIFRQAIERINRLNGYKISVDIPSGVNGDTGEVADLAVKADLTITMGLIKTGQMLYPGRLFCGRLAVANLGVSYQGLAKTPTFLLDADFVSAYLPKRKPDGHKGTFGSVLVIAGGNGYSGAACLTSLSALTIGAGIVRLAFPENIRTAVEKKLTEVIKVPLPATNDGSIALAGYSKIKEVAEKSDVIAIGPGLTTNAETKALVQKLIRTINLPMVIDADGLNNLSSAYLMSLSKDKRRKLILTPHPGEFARLFEVSVADVNANRLEIVRQWAEKLASTIVLKGAPTVISDYQGKIYLNPTGNSGLAKGGSGDVLTGMIAGLIAQRSSLTNAACLGVYLHGLAADIAVKNKTEYSLLASDIIKFIPKALSQFKTKEAL
ncbi:MAG: NAD(P)H-hydrate dehydratase [candidate division WOR-3 bacterium]